MILVASVSYNPSIASISSIFALSNFRYEVFTVTSQKLSIVQVEISIFKMKRAGCPPLRELCPYQLVDRKERRIKHSVILPSQKMGQELRSNLQDRS
jgi:hypothetical protein